MSELPANKASLSFQNTAYGYDHLASVGGPPSAVLDAITSSVLYLDRSGTIVFANHHAEQCFASAPLAGKTFVEVAPYWDDPSERQREIKSLIRSGKSIRKSLERSINKGVEAWYHVDKVPTFNRYNQVDGLVLVITDVSDYISRKVALEESEARYKAFIANSTDAIWRYDICPPIDVHLPVKRQAELLQKRAVLAECNEQLARLFDREKIEDVIGLPLHSNGSLTGKRDILKFIKNGYRIEHGELSRRNTSGKVIHIENFAIGIVENGYLTRAWGTSRDVTLQKSYIEHMEYVATHDELTKLPNRALLYKKMDECLESKPKQQMALLIFDLDKFKDINDTLGHVAGDNLLKRLGPRLNSELSGIPGVVARLGGDEFAIFLPNIRNPQHAVVMGHRCLDAICEPFELEGINCEITASVGVAIAPSQANDVSTLMRYADIAMYQAKSNMKGVVIYDSSYDPHSTARLEISGAFGRAIRGGHLRLHYQPKISLNTESVAGFEALVRWNHPDYGAVPPSQFVPIAEASSAIHPMTVWVLNETVKQCAEWRSQGFEVCVAMNLSARNLMDDRIVSEIEDALQKYDIDGQYIEMEITESMIMSDPLRAQLVLDKISALGIKLSVDDYGTGYSSLAYLKKLPVDALKIDMSFIQNMLNDEQDAIIVNSTIQLAHNLGLEVIAEGVESEDVLAQLKELGCDGVQGYHISKPMDCHSAKEWLLSTEYRH